MILDSLFAALWSTRAVANRRLPKTCKPGVESLEERDVPAAILLPKPNLPTFTVSDRRVGPEMKKAAGKAKSNDAVKKFLDSHPGWTYDNGVYVPPGYCGPTNHEGCSRVGGDGLFTGNEGACHAPKKGGKAHHHH